MGDLAPAAILAIFAFRWWGSWIDCLPGGLFLVALELQLARRTLLMDVFTVWMFGGARVVMFIVCNEITPRIVRWEHGAGVEDYRGMRAQCRCPGRYQSWRPCEMGTHGPSGRSAAGDMHLRACRWRWYRRRPFPCRALGVKSNRHVLRRAGALSVTFLGLEASGWRIGAPSEKKQKSSLG